MAQSRFEKIGTIYSRISGLYKSGAIKSEQIPLWVPIYEKCPPKYEPRWDRQPEERQMVRILYPEDVVRAKYYKKFGDWEVVNLFDNHKPTSQIFVEKYMALSKLDKYSEAELWDRTVSDLENAGVNLTGSREEKQDNKTFESKKMSFKDLFNNDN